MAARAEDVRSSYGPHEADMTRYRAEGEARAGGVPEGRGVQHQPSRLEGRVGAEDPEQVLGGLDDPLVLRVGPGPHT